MRVVRARLVARRQGASAEAMPPAASVSAARRPCTLVMKPSFECIRCREFAAFFRQYIESNERLSVRIVFKHYPLNPECNPHARRMTHPNACAAARAAEAGRLIGGNEGFWRMHDQLFLAENQRALTQAPYHRLAQAAGLDADRLIKLIDFTTDVFPMSNVGTLYPPR